MMKRNRGFTLIELMVTVAVLVILITVAIPSFINLIQNSRSAALANSVVTALNYARSEAVKRNTNVEFCAGTNRTTCAGALTDGWNVQLSDTELLRSWDAPDAGAVITKDVAGVITFTGSGRLNTGAVTLTTKYNNCTGDRSRTIRINASGRVSVTRTAC
ncbi:GspH/FimT family pseudopilin [Neptunomonas concharum]|nr:GspH/FimT family pseudopilin [Neptunomonas concharum]